MTPDIKNILKLAKVPEHSVPLMCAMSGGKPLVYDNYLFFADKNWLMAIAYPLQGQYNSEEFLKALNNAAKETKAEIFFAAGSNLPQKLQKHIIEKDNFYVIPANAKIPKRLKNPVNHALEKLEITEGAIFTPAHRRLWAEFLKPGKAIMTDRVRELYATTPQAMAKANGKLKLLDARLPDGSIAASLLLDYSCDNFTGYILGAHSHTHYVAHATDALFAEMIAHSGNKRFIHLGLGVNEGILRFKRKWGAVKSWPYQMAQWEKKQQEDSLKYTLANVFIHSNSVTRSQIISEESSQKPFAMIWQLEKNCKTSFISGTAHFFCHSFASSFNSLFNKVDNVIFEGPLDAAFMKAVEENGKKRKESDPCLLDMLTESEIARLEKTVAPNNSWFAAKNTMQRKVDVRYILQNSTPWHAFFTLWTTFLEKQGWKDSVDMEAWQIANDMGKNVIAMENLQEQLESLGSLPKDRVIRFFRDCKNWKKRAKDNEYAYLSGDLEKMMGSSAEFPTRTEHIVGRRDQRFRERMMPYIEAGRTAVFVGCAHMVNLRHMLAEDGFIVRQAPFGIWPKLHGLWRNLINSDDLIKW